MDATRSVLEFLFLLDRKNIMENVNKIITHGGQAHLDDTLAVCVLLHHIIKDNSLPIILERRNPTKEELDDPNVWVLDIGGEYNPDKKNFDHHQLKENICAATMLMDHLWGKSYRDFVQWPEFVETWDSNGPSKAMELLGSTQEKSGLVKNPLAYGLISIFSSKTKLEFVGPNPVENTITSIMSLIGSSLYSVVESSQKCLDELTANAVFLEHNGFRVLDMTGCNLIHSSETNVIDLFCNNSGKKADIILARDARDNGHFRMVRLKDDTISFKQLEGVTKFVHQSGFLVSFRDKDNWKKIIDSSTKGRNEPKNN